MPSRETGHELWLNSESLLRARMHMYR
jgi:hypothetical protein